MKKQFLLLTFLLSAIFYPTQAQSVLWAEAYGGIYTDVSNAIAIDTAGNTYITGTFTSPSLDFGSGIVLTNTGNNDMFVAKFDPSGNILWADNAAGTGDELGNDIAVDASGNVYVTGSFSGAGGVTFGSLPPLSNSGGYDFNVVKYNSAGVPLWAITNLAGFHADRDEFGNGIAVDASNVYIIGSFNSSEFKVNSQNMLNSTISSTPPFDIFVLKLNSSTGVATWNDVPFGMPTTGTSVDDDDFGTDIKVSSFGNLFITGYFKSVGLAFPGLTPLTNSGAAGTFDIFIAEYSSAGLPVWSVNPYGTGDDYSRSIAVDGSENVYITGNFDSPSLSLGGTSVSNSGTVNSDYFVAKCSPSLSLFSWVQSANGNFKPFHNFDDVGKSLVLDDCGNLYVTGWYNSEIINFGTGYISNATNNNYSELFVAKYNANTGNILQLFQGHEVLNDQGMDVAVNNCACPVVTGWFNKKLNLTGTYLSNNGPAGTSDFYVGQICNDTCLQPCDYPIVQLNTGDGIPIGATDANWEIVSWPAGINPTSVVACPWFSTAPVSWSYHAPITGTQWISAYDSSFTTPEAPIGTYKFKRTFTLDSLQCENPLLTLCVLVDDSATILLNGIYIGNANSLSSLTTLTASGYAPSGPFVNGINTLQVEVNNLIPNQMAFDLWGVVCCCSNQNTICDSVYTDAVQTTSDTYTITLTNTSNTVDFNSIVFSTAAGIPSMNPSGLPAGWTIFPSGTGLSSFTLSNSISGPYSATFNLDLDCYPSFDPQVITVQWIGWNNITQDTVYCYDTLQLKCQENNYECDSLWVSYEQTDSCCDIVTFTNAASNITVDNIQLSTASGNTTLTVPTTLPTGWTVSPGAGSPVSSFMLFPFTTGSFSNSVSVCVEPDPDNNPQQINIVWMGFDNNNDTVWCYDTLDIYCPYDNLACDSCDKILQTIKTGVTPPVWTLLSAPPGSSITTGVPATNVPSVSSPWRAPFPGSQWISYSSAGGGWLSSTSAPLGEYHYQTQFCICDTCAQGEKLSFHFCLLADDTAKIYLNSNLIGTATSQTTPFVNIIYGPFVIGGVNTIDVYVENNPPYFTGFDFEGWICCDNSNGINQTTLDDEVKLFPNPANRYVYLKSSLLIHSIEVYSLFGQRITSAEINDYSWNLNTNNLTSGIYFVKINTEAGVINKRMIVKH